jgi:hypothetical protein
MAEADLVFCTAADEIEKVPNLPAIAGGERILAEIQQMRNEAQQTRNETRNEAQQTRNETREHLTRLEERITASHQSLLTALRTLYISPLNSFSITILILDSNANNAARVHNTYLSGPSDQISPFLNPLTGAIIPTFPTTPAELGQMRERDVNATLEELGLEDTLAGTSLAMKKRRLRVHIGLRPQVEKSA